MAIVFSNSRNPKLARTATIIASIIGVVFIVLYIVLSDKDYAIALYICGLSLVNSVIILGSYYTNTIILDEEQDTITQGNNKKYPLQISRLKSIAYKENKKGRFRALLIHDNGVGYMELRTSKQNADLIVEQLTRIKPSVEIKRVNYI